MRFLCVLMLALLTCSCSQSPVSYTYDDGKGTTVLLQGKQVKVTSKHFDAVEYQLASDNMALKLSEQNAKIDKAAPATSPPSLSNGKNTVAASSVPEALVLFEQLVPVQDGVGPDSVWVGGKLTRESLEGGFWQLTAHEQKFVLAEAPPDGFGSGATILVTGAVATDELSAANAGPQYRVAQWRLWKP